MRTPWWRSLLRPLPVAATACVLLLAGCAMPVIFLVMIVDQRMQRRMRRASRRKRHRLAYPSDHGGASTRTGDFAPTTTRAADLPPSTTR